MPRSICRQRAVTSDKARFTKRGAAGEKASALLKFPANLPKSLITKYAKNSPSAFIFGAGILACSEKQRTIRTFLGLFGRYPQVRLLYLICRDEKKYEGLRDFDLVAGIPIGGRAFFRPWLLKGSVCLNHRPEKM